MNYFKLIIPSLTTLLLLTIACNPRQHTTDKAIAAFAGDWEIVKVVRNLDDITRDSDFSGPLLTLHEDGSYVVSKTVISGLDRDGVWKLKKQTTGMTIVMMPAGNNSSPAFEIQTTDTRGVGYIIIEFSTRSSNYYQYILKKTFAKVRS